jgi:adenylate kinase family enzyme
MRRHGDFDRVAIVGMSCAGKSTLARRLGERLGTPHFNLDELHWGPNWTARSAEEFLASVERATAGARWIIDGNYRAVRHVVLRQATTVIWLNLPLSTLLPRAFRRTFKRLITREQLFNGNREPLLGFLNSYWIPWWVLANYRELRRELTAQLALPEFGHLRVIEIHSARDIEESLKELGTAVRN